MKNGIKKIILVMLVMLFAVVYNKDLVMASQQKLSDLTEEECILFLEEAGVQIPQALSGSDTIGTFVKDIISCVEKNPNVVLAFNFSVTKEFVEDIRNVVNEYYGVEQTNTSLFNMRGSGGSLVYSTALFSWSESYMSYNCYSYAVGKTGVSYDPGEVSGIDVMSNFSTVTIARLALIVTYDIKEWGYTEVTYSSTCPSYTSGYRVIAVRKNAQDFHFMYMPSSGMWYHKPSTSVPLRYNYSSAAAGVWTNECLMRNQVYPATYTYDSDIVYIRYKL